MILLPPAFMTFATAVSYPKLPTAATTNRGAARSRTQGIEEKGGPGALAASAGKKAKASIASITDEHGWSAAENLVLSTLLLIRVYNVDISYGYSMFIVYCSLQYSNSSTSTTFVYS